MPAIAGPDSRADLVQVRTRLTLSVLKWWFAIYRAWTHGRLGSDWISPGTALSPVDTRQLATPLVRVVKTL